MISKVIQQNLSRIQIHPPKYRNRYLCHAIRSCSNSGDSKNVDRKSKLRSLLDTSATFVETRPRNEEDRWSTLPYVEGTTLSKQNRHDLDIERPKIDPEDTSIILFPGHGSQFVGMAKSLENVPVARDLFDFASEIMG